MIKRMLLDFYWIRILFTILAELSSGNIPFKFHENLLRNEKMIFDLNSLYKSMEPVMTPGPLVYVTHRTSKLWASMFQKIKDFHLFCYTVVIATRILLGV